jgi:uncharacterized protein (DUF697 family)
MAKETKTVDGPETERPADAANAATDAHSAASHVDSGFDAVTKRSSAETVIKDHMLVSLGAGLLPVPGLDLSAGFVSQLVMVRRICKIYDVKFSSKAARTIILALCSGLSGAGASLIVAASIGKLVPGAGLLAGAAAMPISTAALTHALGNVFIAHFELGGDLRNLNAEEKTGYFKDLYQRGKSVATGIWDKKSTQTEESALSPDEVTA